MNQVVFSKLMPNNFKLCRKVVLWKYYLKMINRGVLFLTTIHGIPHIYIYFTMIIFFAYKFEFLTSQFSFSTVCTLHFITPTPQKQVSCHHPQIKCLRTMMNNEQVIFCCIL